MIRFMCISNKEWIRISTGINRHVLNLDCMIMNTTTVIMRCHLGKSNNMRLFTSPTSQSNCYRTCHTISTCTTRHSIHTHGSKTTKIRNTKIRCTRITSASECTPLCCNMTRSDRICRDRIDCSICPYPFSVTSLCR